MAEIVVTKAGYNDTGSRSIGEPIECFLCQEEIRPDDPRAYFDKNGEGVCARCADQMRVKWPEA